MTEMKPEVKSKLGFHSTKVLLNENSRINSAFLRETAKLIEQPGEASISELSQCLKDHVFFLSVHKRIINEKQMKDLKYHTEMLGGRLESFFGQDVTCLLTDEAVFPQANKNNEKPSISNPSSMFISARSRNLATLAPNLNKNCPKTSVINIFTNAKQWGQAIWKIDYFIQFVKQIVVKIKSSSKPSSSKTKIGIKSRSPRYVKPGVMSEKTKVMYLQKYFVKVESTKRNKFPLYKNLPFYPNIEISTATKNGSPFNDKFDKIEKMNKDKASTKPSFLQTSSGEIVSRAKTSNTVTKTKKQKIGHRFYCQCCNTNFSSYERHTNGPRHQAFVKKKENFQCIYDVLKEFNIKSELEDDSIKIQDDSSNGYYSDESLMDIAEEVNCKRPCKALSSLSSDVSMPIITRNEEFCLKNSSNLKVNEDCDFSFDCPKNFYQNPVETDIAVNYSFDSNRFEAKLTLIENLPSKMNAELNCIQLPDNPNLAQKFENSGLVNLYDPDQSNSVDVGNHNNLADANLANIHKSYLTNLEETNLINIQKAYPTNIPEAFPKNIPEAFPTNIPEALPTNIPEAFPTNIPEAFPTNIPEAFPTNIPEAFPTNIPEAFPTNIPEAFPTNIPEAFPTNIPEAFPTNIPEAFPTNIPEAFPTNIPEAFPTNIPEVFPPNIAETYLTNIHGVFPTNINEVFPTNINEVFPTNINEVFPTNINEVFPTNIQEVYNTNFQEGYSTNIQETFLTNLDNPYPNISDQSFEKKINTNSDVADVQEPNLDNNVLEQFLKLDDQDGDRVSQMLKILKESVGKTNLGSTKVSDNAEPLSLQFDDPLPTLPCKNDQGNSFCSEDSNDSLSRFNIDQVVNRVLEDNDFVED